MTALFDNTGRPSLSLISILNVLQLKHENTLESIVSVTQKNLLRPANKERWEVADVFSDKKNVLDPLFKKIHCIQAIHSARSHYDYAVILGALFSRVRDRLNWLIDEWRHGVRFKTLVFLSGQRALIDAEREQLKAFLHGDNVPTNEFEMTKSVYESIAMPESLRKVPVVFINAPAICGRVRATTEDTVREWLALHPKPGSVLAVSNQPYIFQQHCVLRLLLPAEFAIESIGPEIASSTATTIILDNLARWIFQIKRLCAVYAFA